MLSLCSVVCVSYNHAKFAMAGLQSVFSQAYRNIEIVVLDDGSSDESVSIIRETLKSSPFKATFIEQLHSGNVPANFNRALKEASGEFVVIMSLDDLLMPGCIDDAIKVLSKNEDIVFFANSGHYEIDENGERLTPNIHLPDTSVKILAAKDLLENEYNKLGVFYIQGQVFRKNILEKVGFFDEDMTGDDIVLRTKIFLLMLENPQMQFSLGSDVVLAYRKHGGNLHKKTFRQIKTVVEWRERYFPTRPYPPLFYRWLDHFFLQTIRNGELDELTEARLYSVVIESRFKEFKKTWKYKRNLLKQRVRNWITQGY